MPIITSAAASYTFSDYDAILKSNALDAIFVHDGYSNRASHIVRLVPATVAHFHVELDTAPEAILEAYNGRQDARMEHFQVVVASVFWYHGGIARDRWVLQDYNLVDGAASVSCIVAITASNRRSSPLQVNPTSRLTIRVCHTLVACLTSFDPMTLSREVQSL